MSGHLRGSENGNRYSPTGREILTRHGRMIDLTDVDPTLIYMSDIAASLAHQERFTGMCPLRPSIAQHSLAVEHIAMELWRLGGGRRVDSHTNALRRAALMHDAAEFLVGDVTGAIKKLMRVVRPITVATGRTVNQTGVVSRFDELEGRAQRAINFRFDCADNGFEDIVHEADCIACAYEMRFDGWCMEADPPAWTIRDNLAVRFYQARDGGELQFLARAAMLGMVDADA